MNTYPDISSTLPALKSVCAFTQTHDLYGNVPLPASPEDFLKLPSHDRAFLQRNAGNISHLPETKVRYLASEFDPSKIDTLFLVPQEVDRIWDSFAQELERHKPKVAMAILPLFWQTGPMFYTTARSQKVPVTVLPPHNLPLAAQVFEEAEVEAIVTTDATALEFYPTLLERGLDRRIKFWHIVSPLSLQPAFQTGTVYHEKHLFPGVPIACRGPQAIEPHAYTPSPRYFFECGDKTRITSLSPEALTLLRYELPAKTRIFTEDNGAPLISFE